MKLVEWLERIKRIDRLIRLKATGSPKALANKLELSERSIHRLIDTMKSMGAPIQYCNQRQSYYYREKAHFRYGFFLKDDQTEYLQGGTQLVSFSCLGMFEDFLYQENDLL